MAILLWTLKPGAATAATGFLTTGPKAERLGAGAARYSLVSIIHHMARGKARPVMGCKSVRSALAVQPGGGR